MHPNVNALAEAIRCQYGAVSTALAAGTGDATEVNGAALDVNGNYGSLKVALTYTTTLTEDKTLTFAANLQTADDSSFTENAADYGDALTSTVVATGATSGSTSTGVLEFDFDLRAARRYVRIQYTPDLSHSGTDTATIAATYILGGATEQPQTARVN